MVREGTNHGLGWHEPRQCNGFLVIININRIGKGIFKGIHIYQPVQLVVAVAIGQRVAQFGIMYGHGGNIAVVQLPVWRTAFVLLCILVVANYTQHPTYIHYKPSTPAFVVLTNAIEQNKKFPATRSVPDK